MKRTPLNRTRRLAPRSKKRATLYRKVRIPLVTAILTERPICERCQSRRSVDVHEMQSRGRGGSISTPENLTALCRTCHDWATQNPALARAEGWLRHSWEAA